MKILSRSLAILEIGGWSATLAGQERIYDSDTFNSWLAAKLDGKEQATEFFERRFRDEYRPRIYGLA